MLHVPEAQKPSLSGFCNSAVFCSAKRRVPLHSPRRYLKSGTTNTISRGHTASKAARAAFTPQAGAGRAPGVVFRGPQIGSWSYKCLNQGDRCFEICFETTFRVPKPPSPTPKRR